MELGIYHEFPVLPGRSQAECFAAGFDIVDATDAFKGGFIFRIDFSDLALGQFSFCFSKDGPAFGHECLPLLSNLHPSASGIL